MEIFSISGVSWTPRGNDVRGEHVVCVSVLRVSTGIFTVQACRVVELVKLLGSMECGSVAMLVDQRTTQHGKSPVYQGPSGHPVCCVIHRDNLSKAPSQACYLTSL